MPEPRSPILILGARSDIGRALARAYAAAGCDLTLAARRAEELIEDCTDLELRYKVRVQAVEFDVAKGDPELFFRTLGEVPGTVILTAGLLGDQDQSAHNDHEAELVLVTNFSGPVRYLLAAARTMKSGPGTAIIGISSVAGDRGRASNYVYGSAKAGLTAFLSGLRNSLTQRQIHVVTVKPGFVDTRMTAGMHLPALLTASSDQVASRILRAHRRSDDIVYVKPVWRWIMLGIKIIPESIFKKLKI